LYGHDYSLPGFYFVTICLDNIRCMLAIASTVVVQNSVGVGHGQPLQSNHTRRLQLTPIGDVAEKYWAEIPNHFPNVAVDEFVIMPDHVHGILNICDLAHRFPVGVRHGNMNNDVASNGIVGVGHGQPLPKLPTRRNGYQHVIPKSLGMIINHYKSAVTRWCRQNGYPQFKWQRSFYDQIIGDEGSLFQIRQYIRNNPANWFGDHRNHLKNELNGL
jgi:putative transposase